jgi:hypothetical protein
MSLGGSGATSETSAKNIGGQRRRSDHTLIDIKP